MATKTVTLHNPYKGKLPTMTTKKKRKPAAKKSATKKPPAAKKRRRRSNPAPAAYANPAPRKRARKRRAASHAGPAATHRRRRVRRNPEMPVSEMLVALGLGALVPALINTAALQYAKLDPVATRKYQHLGGAAVAAVGAYLSTTKHRSIGLALIGGGAAAALSTDLTERGLALLNGGGLPGISTGMKGLVDDGGIGALQLEGLTDAQIAGILDSPEVQAMSPVERQLAAAQIMQMSSG